MAHTAESHTSRPAASEQKDPVLKFLQAEPHRTYTAEEVARSLTPQAAKDPLKKSQAIEEMTTGLRKLVEAGHAVEIGPGSFKARLFFDKEEKNIEHAFLGGMGNALYHFRSPIFRLNIGVLSLFFVRDNQAAVWMVTIRDTTIGRDYCLMRRLRDGAFAIGSRPPEAGEVNYLQIEGRYIDKKQVTITFSGDEVGVEDHNTLNGTRIDLLTRDGLTRYEQLAEAFLRSTDPGDYKDIVKRGRFVLEKFLHSHQNFETTFFSAVVDSLLLTGFGSARRT